MARGDTSQRPAIDADLPSELHLVHKEVEDPLRVKLAVVGVAEEATRGRIPIVPIVPAHHIDASLKEEAEPVGVR